MARKEQLRQKRAGTVLNLTSRQQESVLGQALHRVVEQITEEFKLTLVHHANWFLKDIVEELSQEFPEVEFYEPSRRSFLKPDGGILAIEATDQKTYPILIAEVKNQGTNDLRLAEGKTRQAQGNAIERLGKNVIGLRAALLKEGIVPFVCFGYGVDFEEGSSILERVATIAMFGRLNVIHLVNAGAGGQFNRGSFYFRREEWTAVEMAHVMQEIARRSVLYYLAKYGFDYFARDPSFADTE